MKISMYQASVPPMIRALENLAHVLSKGQAFAEARKIDPSVLVGSRLAPDMFPLSNQVQIAADAAKFGGARLAGLEAPAFPDDEKTIADLIERTRKTVAYLQTLKPEQFEGAEDRTVTWKVRDEMRSMQGLNYLQQRVLPNLYFHVTTAYDILRHNGVEVGKGDYLGKM
jgi:hypothetical protein